MRFTKTAIQDGANQAIYPEAGLCSDALPSLNRSRCESGPAHAVRTSSGRESGLHPECRTVNTVRGPLETAISETYLANPVITAWTGSRFVTARSWTPTGKRF
ncbi:MAG: hypothetical protein ACT4QA_11515 [Panacagrimonas sp.]